MATFFCSECNFSKPVKDEMAGKKARCPKCNAVNVVPELGEEPSIEPVTETDEPYEEQAQAVANAEATASTESQESTVSSPSPETSVPEATTPATESVSTTVESSAGTPRLSMGWLMAFGGAILPFLAGALLLCFSFEMITFAVICFAIGMLAFGGLAAYYSFT